MRRAQKTWMAIALLLVIMGSICLVISFGMGGFDFSKWSRQHFTTNTHIIEDDFDDIEVCTLSEDIRLVVSETGKAEIVCSESDSIQYQIAVENGTLKVSFEDTRKWYEKMDFFVSSHTPVTIYLPKNRYGNVDLTSVSGDISIPQGFYFSNLSVTTTSGDVANASIADRTLSVTTTSGDIHIRPSSNLTKMDSVYVKVTTGDVEMRGIHAADVVLHLTTGDVAFSHFDVGNLTVRTTTGDIVFQDLRASGSVEMATTSGDVKGVVRSRHTFDARATSGNVRVPYTERNGASVFKIRVTSGDIKIEEKLD